MDDERTADGLHDVVNGRRCKVADLSLPTTDAATSSSPRRKCRVDVDAPRIHDVQALKGPCLGFAAKTVADRGC